MSSTSTRELNKQGRYRGGSPRAAAILALAACGIATNVQAAPPVFTGPLPYQSIADSPYFGDGQTCYALETFPDGVQSQPSFQFNSQTGAEIVPGVGVPPGGHVLQANTIGVIQLTFDPPVNEAGFVWTGGDPIGSTITMTVISGTEAVSQQYASLSPNDPDNPDDNRFFGVTWDVGIQALRITFLPFGRGIPNQIDHIQFAADASASTDSDGDGVVDCLDDCPLDPNKTEPGVCGCGTADDDSDGDGAADCVDGCPDDPNKTAPGVCGCGTAEYDSDGDGAADCVDGCPDDPNKTEPGVCGCGTAEDDSDGDGVPDCIDPCSDDGQYESPTQSPFGSDHALEHTFQGLAEPLSDGTLEIEVRADLGSFSEFVTVYFEGESLGLFFTVDGADCPKKAGVVSIPIAQSSLEAAIADGGVEVRVVASPLVGAGDCPTSLARARLLYATSFPDCDGNGSDDGCDIEDGVVRDCNENLIPDSCDLANGLLVDCDGNGLVDLCEILDDPSLDENSDGSLDMCSYAYGDFDLDGSIGGADLAYLLSIWGLSNIPIGDLTGDGSIGGADLAALLSRWGTSPP
jgi:hypothetical protein